MDKRKGINRNKWSLIALLLWTLSLGPCLYAQNNEQEQFIEETQLLEIEGRMLFFYDQLQEIANKLPLYTADNLPKASQQVSAIDSKWDVYCQTRQTEIANDDSLLQIVANYQLVKQGLLDSIAYNKQFFLAVGVFGDAEFFFA